MKQSKTITYLKSKITKIVFLLMLVRLGLYIPIPNVDLDIFTQNQMDTKIFGFATMLTGSSFLSIGSLGILPYINASIMIQLLVPVIPGLEQLQKDEGEFGRQQITKYTRYLTFIWSIFLSSGLACFLVKPTIFNWTWILGLQIVLALVTGSMLSMWFCELITQEKLGNGSSILIFINIIGNVPNSLNDLNNALFGKISYFDNLKTSSQILILYFFFVSVIILFQTAYKKVYIISAKQLTQNSSNQNFFTFKNTYLPFKINQGGIMPLVFSSTIVGFIMSLAKFFIKLTFINDFAYSFINFLSIALNIILIIFFSCFYAALVLKPNDISQNLTKMAYIIPEIRQGKDTTKYLENLVERLAFIGGLFLSFLVFFPLIIDNFLQVNIFKNVTSLLILIGVITDVTAELRVYRVLLKYEKLFKR